MVKSLMLQMMYLFVMIIMLALMFGIVNTMLMVVLERRREFGMLMAVGLSRRRVFTMVLFETVTLAVTGGIAGMLLGAGSIAITRKTGIDLSALGEGLAAMGYSPMVYPAIDFSFFMLLTVMVIVAGILAAVYPAFKALALDPAAAVRSDT